MKNYNIVELNLSENAPGIDKAKQEILGLWERNQAEGFAGRFEWLYRKNPLGNTLTWCAVNGEDNAAAGHCIAGE
jgi:hypothetical protein